MGNTTMYVATEEKTSGRGIKDSPTHDKKDFHDCTYILTLCLVNTSVPLRCVVLEGTKFRVHRFIHLLLYKSFLCRKFCLSYFASMDTAPVLVNKQFNSPIMLYSPENVHDVMSKQAHILANGTVGIDFHKMAAPGNLKNSAVLRMLEEAEKGEKGVKRVTWPPPPPDNSTTNGVQESVYPKEPVFYKPISPPRNQQPQHQHPDQSWSPEALVSPPAEPVFQRTIQTAAPVFEPPPTVVTLRQSAPFYQAPPPIFESQPAAKRVRNPRMRGDEKWPPAETKAQAAAENEARKALAKGPAFRPRRQQKDYSKFFAQHAIANNYPGYRAPPGTQHYIEEGTSNF